MIALPHLLEEPTLHSCKIQLFSSGFPQQEPFGRKANNQLYGMQIKRRPRHNDALETKNCVC